jgi:hypothetical protein
MASENKGPVSAYALWLAEGHTGTKAQFLASLKGPPGPPGADGTDGGSFTNTDPTLTSLGGIPAGTTFNDVPVADVLSMLLYPYQAPQVSISTTPAPTAREKGVSVNITNIATTVTKRSNPITSVVLKRGAATLQTFTPSGATQTLNYTTTVAISDTTSFTSTVGDGTGTNTATVTHTFYDPVYSGFVAATPDDATIRTLTKALQGSRAKAVSYTGSGKFCYAYPASYGNITKITDPNGFNITTSFALTTVNVTAASGTVLYNVYTLLSDTGPFTNYVVQFE